MILFTNDKSRKKTSIRLLRENDFIINHLNYDDHKIIKDIEIIKLNHFHHFKLEDVKNIENIKIDLCVIPLFKKEIKLIYDDENYASVDIFSLCILFVSRKIESCYPTLNLNEIQLPRGIIIYCLNNISNTMLNHGICKILFSCFLSELMTAISKPTENIITQGIMNIVIRNLYHICKEDKLVEREIHYQDNKNLSSMNRYNIKLPLLSMLHKSIPFVSESSIRECVYTAKVLNNLLQHHKTLFIKVIEVVSRWLLLFKI